MTSIVVDTNVLLSFLTDRDAAQQKKSSDLLRAAASRDLELVLHQQVVTEIIYVLMNRYGQSRGHTAEIIADLLALPGVVTVDRLEWSGVLALWPKPFRDFSDAVLAATCRSGRHDAVATFDETFKRLLEGQGLQSYW
jgi:predicted nucleic acid-binding protein